MPSTLLLAVLTSCVLLAVGLLLRARLRVFHLLYIPASVIAGLVGFGVVQAVLHSGAVAKMVAPVTNELGGWPGPLIAVVFAGLLLERSSNDSFSQALRRGARSGALAWIIILGQIAIGLFVYLVAVKPFHTSVPASFGQLLEVSWAGGHGTSGAMAEVYAAQGFPEGRDLAFFLATIGLIYGVISGLVLVNIAIRRGWTHAGEARGSLPIVTGLEPSRDPQPVAFGRTRREVMDPMTLQVVILGLAFAVGMVLQWSFISIASMVFGADDPTVKGELIDFVGNVPLFLFTLLGGWGVRSAMALFRIERLIDSASLHRLLGVAMDFLIVAAIATMRVDAVWQYWKPVSLLFVLAAVWTAVCLLVIAPRLLPREYWFELGLLNYGFATANTPQGLMLLRIVDPELKTRAAEDYAVAAPLSAPFIGGGVVTFLLPLLLTKVHASLALAAACALALSIFVGARWLTRSGGAAAPAGSNAAERDAL